MALQHEFPEAELVKATFLLDGARFIKSDEELACLEAATLLAEGAAATDYGDRRLSSSRLR